MKFLQFVFKMSRNKLYHKTIKTSITFIVLLFLFSCKHSDIFIQKCQDVCYGPQLYKYEIKPGTDLDFYLNFLCKYDSNSDFHIFMECRYPSLMIMVYSTDHHYITWEIICKSKIDGFGEFRGHKVYIHQFENCSSSKDYTVVLENYFYNKNKKNINCDSVPKLIISDSCFCKKDSLGVICIFDRL